MTHPPVTVDILPPPYPGDVGVDPIQYFGLNYPKPELAGYNKVALRMAQPPQTKDRKQKTQPLYILGRRQFGLKMSEKWLQFRPVNK